MSSSTRNRAKILSVLVCLVLIDKAESPHTKIELQKYQGSFKLGREPDEGGLGRDAVDELEARKSETSFARVLLQRTRRSQSRIRSDCDLSPEVRERIHDTSTGQWLITDDGLEELNYDVQAVVECANENEILLFASNSTIKPTRTLVLSRNLTLASQSGSIANGSRVSASERVRLTCPDSGQLLLSRSPSFTLSNVVIEDCNTTSSVIQMDPDCSNEASTGIVRFDGLILERNVMLEQGHVIHSSNSRCLQLELNSVAIRRNRCARHCIVLSMNNTLSDIELVRNVGSNNDSDDSSIFSSARGSEIFARNVTSDNNEIRSFHLTHSTLRIANSNFSDNIRNVSSETRDASTRGGVIFADQSLVFIYDTTFERNYAFRGGCLYLSGSTSAEISGSGFLNNRAEGDAGAIYLNSDVDLLLQESLFKENQAQQDGGALSTRNFCNTTILNCGFTNNTSHDDGGAIRLQQNATTTLANSTFQGNRVQRKGAALSTWGSCNTRILNCTFTNNTSHDAGGAIRLQEYSTTTLAYSTFQGNQAHRYGGALSTWGSCSTRILNCAFTNNTSHDTGGAIRLQVNSTTTLENSTFQGNHARRHGGALSTWDFCNTTILNCGFTNNTSHDDGGALRLQEYSTTTLQNSTFHGNQARGHGGALSTWNIYNNTILYCSFTNNTSHDDGGAIWLHQHAIATFTRSTATFTHSTFKGNQAGRHGGALHAWHVFNATIRNCSFINNTSSDYGGAVHLHASSICMMSTDWDLNRAKYGGSLVVFNASMEVIGLTIRRSYAQRQGGAILLRATSARLEKVRLESNEAMESGGGIALVDGSSIQCYLCSILNNEAFSGAGVYAFSNDSSLVVAQFENSTFENNYAQSHGGGVELDASRNKSINCSSPNVTCGHIILLDTSFVGNYASHSGAIVLTADPNRVLVNCTYRRGGRRNQDFLNRTEIDALKTIDPKNPCTSWMRNRVSSDASEGVVGTYGQEIELTMDPVAEVRLVGSVASGYILENVRSGKQMPPINMTILDGYGTERALTLPRNFEARISSPDGFFTGVYPATIAAGFGQFSRVSGFATPKNYTFEFTFDDKALEPFNVTVMVRECMIGEESTRDGLTCQECDAFSYNFNASDVRGCEECPDDATCEGRYIVPKNGHWHKSPCHDTVQECLIEEACSYKGREEALLNFTQNSTDCSINEMALETYNGALCREGYEGPLCGSCLKDFGLTFIFQCLRCPHKGVSFLIIAATTLYLLGIASLTIRGCLPSNTKKAQSRRSRVQSNRRLGTSVQDREVSVEMVQIVEGRVSQEDFPEIQEEEASTSQTPTTSPPLESQYDLTKWKTTEMFKVMLRPLPL